MPLELIDRKARNSRPVYVVAKGALGSTGLDASALAWAKGNGFDGEAGRVLTVPGAGGEVAAALFGTGKDEGAFVPLATGTLARNLPDGDWHFETPPANAFGA